MRRIGFWMLAILALARCAMAQSPRFVEVARAAGLWQTGIGWGASWADMDQDGWIDALLPCHDLDDPFLYRNTGDRFVDASAAIPAPPYADHHVWRWADIDNDGDPDLSSGVGSTGGRTFRPCEVFLNRGDGTFEDATDEIGLGGDKKRGRAVTWFDADNDGWLDAMITANLPENDDPKYAGFRGLQLFHNLGGTRFEDVTMDSGAHLAGHSYWAAPGDFDNDGDLDVFVERLNERPTLLENLGQLRFRDIASRFPFANLEDIDDVDWTDFDNDGDLDLFISQGAAGRNGVSEGYHVTGNELTFLFERNGQQDEADEIAVHSPAEHVEIMPCEEFTEVVFSQRMFRPSPAQVLIGGQAVHPKSLPVEIHLTETEGTVPGTREALGRPEIADLDRPSVSVWREPEANVWHIRFSRAPDDKRDRFSARVAFLGPIQDVAPVECESRACRNYLFENRGGNFLDVTQNAGLADEESTGDALWQDFDNDGDADLLSARTSYSLHDAPPMIFYENDGKGRFRACADGLGLDQPVIQSRCGVVCGDYDNDGYQDLLVGPGLSNPPFRFGASRLFHNEGGANHWLKIRLRGHKSAADAIGAWVFMEANGRRQTRYHLAGQSFDGQDSSLIHFGLGQSNSVDRLVVRWPSGVEQAMQNVRADQLLRVEELESP